MNDEKVMAICSTVNYVKANATKEACEKCGTGVFLSESTILAVQENHPTYTKNDLFIVCIPCGMETMDKAKDIKISKPTELQKKQVKEFILEEIILKNHKN